MFALKFVIQIKKINHDLSKAFTENEVNKCLKKMNNGKSAGLDKIYPEFIESILDSLIKVMTKFFNRIQETTEVPDEWAISIYQPVFKKGNRNDPNNYMGISLSSCLCKLFTALLTEMIQSDLDERNMVGREQVGFRKKYELYRPNFCLNIFDLTVPGHEEKVVSDFH